MIWIAVTDDAQSAITTPRVPRTWSSRWPISRLDHIFLSPDLTVSGVTVPRTMLDQIASDHLPLLVQMRLPDGPFPDGKSRDSPDFPPAGRGLQ